jgi:hypothetical protein
VVDGAAAVADAAADEAGAVGVAAFEAFDELAVFVTGAEVLA